MAEKNGAPLFSVVIAADGSSAHLLARTLESVISQKEESLEIIVVEKNSDPIGSFIRAYYSHIFRIYSATNENLFAMMNKGLSLSRGSYVHFLLPGEFYNSERVYTLLKETFISEESPDLICTGFLARHLAERSKIVFYTLSKEALETTKFHSSLQSFFFKRTLFDRVGVFNPALKYQGNFEFLSRFTGQREIKIHDLRRVVTDYEVRKFSPEVAIEEAVEQLKIICRAFGFGRALFWWIAQNHIRFFKWWFRAVREAVWKKPI